jgi:hypothetical protein
MRSRHVLILLATAGAALAAPAPASATLIEIGNAASPGTPACPGSPCRTLTRTTGFQELVAGRRNLYLVPRNATLVAWTVSLSRPSAAQIDFYERMRGLGKASARITVLRRFRRRGNDYRFVVRNQSDIVQLNPYLGKTAQFPVRATFPVYKDDLIAISTSSWAPIMALRSGTAAFGKNSTWRSSRSNSNTCNDEATNYVQTAQRRIGSMVRYSCLYDSARLAYSATLISTP